MKKYLPYIACLLLILTACSPTALGPRNTTTEQTTTSTPTETTAPSPDVCTLIVSCETVLDNLPALDADKHELIPADGVLFDAQEALQPGDTVYDVFRRALMRERFHFEVATVAGTIYVAGIGNLYEFDCGGTSGWLYRVNGVFQSVSCNQVRVAPGDLLEFVYTCDLGRDVGSDFDE